MTPLACSLVGTQQTVTLVPGTEAARLYATADATEDYFCNYGINPAYREALEGVGMRVSGVGGGGRDPDHAGSPGEALGREQSVREHPR